MKLLLLLFITSVTGYIFYGRYAYRVDDYVDRALGQLRAEKEAYEEEDPLQLDDPLVIAGFSVFGPNLTELYNISRNGLSVLLPKDEGVDFYTKLVINNARLEGKNLFGPGISINKPVIYFRYILVTLEGKASTEVNYINEENKFKKECTNKYSPEITGLNGYTRDDEGNIKELNEEWVEGMLAVVNILFKPILRAFFEKYLMICKVLDNENYQL